MSGGFESQEKQKNSRRQKLEREEGQTELVVKAIDGQHKLIHKVPFVWLSNIGIGFDGTFKIGVKHHGSIAAGGTLQ